MFAMDAGMSNAEVISVFIAMVALLLAGAAFLVGLHQYHLAQDQTALAKTQTDIAEKQQKRIEEEFLRRVNLTAYAITARLNPPHVVIDVIVKNIGNRTAKNFYYDLRIPEEWTYQVAVSAAGRDLEEELTSIDGTTYSSYQGFIDTPLFPARYTTLASLRVNLADKYPSFKLRWLLTTEDGQFPKEGIFGNIGIPPREDDHPVTDRVLNAS
jgi:hypothetical protein